MSECMAKTKCIAAITTTAAIAIPLAGTIAQTLSPTQVFEGITTTPAKKNGAIQGVHIVVQSFGIPGERGPNGPTYEVPMRGFYLAHLLGGNLSATVDGQTTQHMSGDYWAVKPGATMQVNVNGEFAVLETTVVSKQ
jgi:hypothetical protein